MGSSKRYKGKACAYCGEPESSSTNDHVVATSFFLDDERTTELDLPKVAACQQCNNTKSQLENYVTSSLLIASRHPQASRYRREKIAPRLGRNRKLRKQLGIDAPAKWIQMNGILQPLHPVMIDAVKTTRLLEMIVRGLYRYHYGRPLSHLTTPCVGMMRPDDEAVWWDEWSQLFPQEASRVTCSLGNGNFVYTRVQSPEHEDVTAWVLGLHGNIRLHGADGSGDHWHCITLPTEEAIAAVESSQV